MARTSVRIEGPLELREALAGEFIGSAVDLRTAPGVADLPLEGTIVDETQEMFEIETRPRGRTIWVAKAGLGGTIFREDRELPLNGDALRFRPQDRTKRLLQAGPRRPR